jgi:hypothetical protein
MDGGACGVSPTPRQLGERAPGSGLNLPPHATTLLSKHPPPKDFIGASGYASTAQKVVPSSHEVTAQTMNFELKAFGM